MTVRTRRASWFVSGLLLLTLAPAGLKLVAAQPKSETPRSAVDMHDATFERLGNHYSINVDNIAYTSDEGQFFDIYFACSSGKNPDPLRLTDANDLGNARAFFGDEKRYGKHLIKINNYCINPRHIAFLESRGGLLVVNFNTRIWESFVQLTLPASDGDALRKKIGSL